MARKPFKRHNDVYEILIAGTTAPEARKAIFKALMAMFGRWNVQALNQVLLLGMEDAGTFLLQRELPRDPVILERVGHLLAIDKALLKLHPYHASYRVRWIDRRVPAFDGKTPLQVMLANGRKGIMEVRHLVESQLDELLSD